MISESSSNTAVLERPAGPALTKWDYEVHSIHARHDSFLQDELQKFGREGWELISMNMPMGNEYHCVFRRPIL